MALAALYGHSEIVEHLLNEGSNVNSRDKGNRTPLHYAVLGNQIEISRLLISKGAIVDAIGDILDENKSTPLHLAVRLGDSEVSVKMSHYYIPSIRAYTMMEGPRSLIWIGMAMKGAISNLAHRNSKKIFCFGYYESLEG